MFRNVLFDNYTVFARVFDTIRIFDRCLDTGLSNSLVFCRGLSRDSGIVLRFLRKSWLCIYLGLKGLYSGSHVFDLVLHFQ